MNKIDNAIKEVHFLDSKATSNKFLNKIHPLVKLLITITYIILLTSLNKYDLSKTLAMFLYLWLISVIGEISIVNCFKKLKIVFLLLVAIGIANPILDRNVITYIGIVPITTGMISAVTLILKGFFAIIASYFLITTTSIENICCALKMLHIPNILITIIMLIYRYIIVFLKEVEKIWTAYQLRAPKQKGVHYTFFVENQKLDKNNILYLIFGVVLVLTIRNVNLKINKNENVGIIGANGAGKSTILKLLVGLETQYQGSILVDNLKVEKKNLSAIRQKIGYVFQDSEAQLFMPTIYEDVAFAPRNYGFSDEEVHRRTMEALTSHDLNIVLFNDITIL